MMKTILYYGLEVPENFLVDVRRAAVAVVNGQLGTASFLRRRFDWGINHASMVIDYLEVAKIIGPFEGSKERAILIKREFDIDQALSIYTKKK